MNLFAPFVAHVQNRPARPNLTFPAAILLAATLAVGSAHLTAQQPYAYSAQPQAPYGYGQYAAPGQPYGSPEPQYAQPQYAQPQYAEPEYGQQQPYAQQPEQPAYAEPAYPTDDQMQPEQGVQQAQPALNPDELEQLVAPIALYPDSLLAQILTASTYPAQVSIADQWLQQMHAQGYGAPDMVASGADAQADWDPSIKALTAFPQVLDTLNHNLEWTTALGNAYYNQPQDVMQTVQVMRERAAAAGTLQSTPQESVSSDQGNIELAPANPQEVYVPAYNPWDVYGQPISPYPGFSLAGALGSFFGGPPISYGLGIALAAFERFPWGFLGWAFDWHGHDVLFGHSSYFTHSASVADWGFPHGGPRAYGGRFQRFGNNNRGVQSYGRAANGFDRGQSLAHPAEPLNRSEQSFARPSEQFNRPAQQRLDHPAQQQFERPDQSFGRPAQQFNHPSQSPIRPRESLVRPAQPFNRVEPFAGAYGFQRGYARPAAPSQQAYNRVPPSYARPQTYPGTEAYTRSPYAYGYANRPAQPFAARPGAYPAYRAPQQTAPRAFAQAQPRGFSEFGRGSEPKNYAGSRAPRSFGGGGGAHYKAPKGPRSSGGGSHHRGR